MTPAEQAKLWADHHNAQAIIRAEQASSRRTRSVLLWIFVGIPLVAIAFWAVMVVGHSGAGQSSRNNSPATTSDPNACHNATPGSQLYVACTDPEGGGG